jgi:hypothetical protein
MFSKDGLMGDRVEHGQFALVKEKEIRRRINQS